VLRTYHLENPNNIHPLVVGRAVGEMVGSGEACVILDVNEIDHFLPGEVLVTSKTDPDWEPIMKQAAAIVTDQGGRTCHAAIIARELGIPAIVGCGNATSVIKTGKPLPFPAAKGKTAMSMPRSSFSVEETPWTTCPPPAPR
jgi:pyruvate,water dikinase